MSEKSAVWVLRTPSGCPVLMVDQTAIPLLLTVLTFSLVGRGPVTSEVQALLVPGGSSQSEPITIQ